MRLPMCTSVVQYGTKRMLHVAIGLSSCNGSKRPTLFAGSSSAVTDPSNVGSPFGSHSSVFQQPPPPWNQIAIRCGSPSRYQKLHGAPSQHVAPSGATCCQTAAAESSAASNAAVLTINVDGRIVVEIPEWARAPSCTKDTYARHWQAALRGAYHCADFAVTRGSDGLGRCTVRFDRADLGGCTLQ